MHHIFIHSMKFVILDSAARVRAYVDGDEPETVTRIMFLVWIDEIELIQTDEKRDT